MDGRLVKQVEMGCRAIATHLSQLADGLSEAERNHQIQNFLLYRVLEHLCQHLGDVPVPQGVFEYDSGILHGFQLPEIRVDWAIAHLGQIYEILLAYQAKTSQAQTKKTGGIYYTPAELVDYVLHHTIAQVDQPFPTILDPACGGGAFLLAAYDALLVRQAKNLGRPLTFSEREQVLQRCIYGIDIDLQAVKVTQLSLWLELIENNGVNGDRSHYPFTEFTSKIYCGNTLLNTRLTSNKFDSVDSNSLNWQQIFAMPMQQGGFDFVIGNPPYVNSELMTVCFPELRRYCNAHYRCAKGNWDLFCVFIERSLQLCKPGGLTSLVVPNKLASADYAAAVRSLLTIENQLLSVKDFAQQTGFAAAVYPMVFVAKRGQQLSTDFSDADGEMGRKGGDRWWINLQPIETTLLQRLQQEFLPLGAIAQINGAATVAEAYMLQAWIQNCEQPQPDDLCIVNSGTIDRYCWLWGQKPMRYLGKSYLHPVLPRVALTHLTSRRQEQARSPKIIVSGMTRRLECGLDDQGRFLAGKSTVILHGFVSENLRLDWRYLLGLLNSQLMSFYFTRSFSGNGLQGGYLRVGAPQLRQLPIAVPDLAIASQRQAYEQIIEGVQQMFRQSDPVVDRAIDQWVYQCYGLTDAEVQWVEQVLS